MKLMNIGKRYGAKIAATSAVFLGSISLAHADAAAAFTALTTKATELEGLAWPVLTVIFVALAAMGLFKKFGRRAVG